MAGLTNLLNIAKVGLMTHQTNLQTIGHNVSNVNTRGYSRQQVMISAATPTPTYIGPLGNGVEAKEIIRSYDQFITRVLFDKVSVRSGLDSRISGMDLIEGILNEVDENGLNGIMDEFWNAWDDLANNAEGMAERSTLLQRASQLVDAIRDKYNTLVQLSKDVDLNIASSINDINRISQEIAELNVQIVSTEASGHVAADMRDQRDQLVRELSELIDIHYFETERGSYTVMVGQGSPLVEDDQAWRLEFSNSDVYWKGPNGQSVLMKDEDLEHGELGGWIEIKRLVSPNDPTELIGSAVNTSGGQAISPATQWGDIDGVSDDPADPSGTFSISFSGTAADGSAINGTYTGSLTDNVDDLLTAIENAYAAAGSTVDATITEDGRIKLVDLDPDTFPISFQIDDISGDIIGLDLGRFTGSYPLNYLETLNTIGTELIKLVNSQHSQGVGLIPLQETTAAYMASNTAEPISARSSGLVFSDEVQTGSFEIWLYDADGNVVDQDGATADINEPVTISVTEGSTSLDDLANAIDGVTGLSADVVDGTLVIGLDGTGGVEGFAFGRDTSNALMTLGINAFFTGTNAATIGLNQDLVLDNRLIAAAQVEPAGVESISSEPVMDAARPFNASLQNGTITITLEGPDGTTTNHNLNLDVAEDSLKGVLDQIAALEGIETASVEDGYVTITTSTGYHITGLAGGGTGLWDFLGISSPPADPDEVRGTLLVERTFDPLSSYNTGVSNGTLQLRLYSQDGSFVDHNINISAGDTLEDVRSDIDAIDGLTAVIEDGRLQIYTTGDAESFAVIDDSSGVVDYLGIATPAGGALSPANNRNALAIRELHRERISSLDDATLREAYQGLIGDVGIKARGYRMDFEFMDAEVNQLQRKRDDISGVSLDEEMSNLIKFQHAYTAAAKLIKAADEMLMSLIQVK